MKKAIISQPMNDRTVEQIKAEREDAITYLETLGYEFMDTLTEAPACKNPALFMFSNSCRVMADCDLVLFVGAWQQARGCQMEYNICRAYGIESMTYYRREK